MTKRKFCQVKFFKNLQKPLELLLLKRVPSYEKSVLLTLLVTYLKTLTSQPTLDLI